MTRVADRAAFYGAEFQRLSGALAAGGPDWLMRARRAAIEAFERLGFPTTRDEEWRFTSVSAIAETAFVPAREVPARVAPADVDPYRLPDAAAELVFVNGEYAAELSRSGGLPGGALVETLGQALASHPLALELHLTQVADFERTAFTALNTAFWTDGVFVHVPAGATIERPIHVLFISTGPDRGALGGAAPRPPAVHPRVLIVAEHDSQASIVESFAGGWAGERALTNAVTEAVVDDHAVVEHYTVQREGDGAFHVATLQAVVREQAAFTSHALTFGGALVRNNINVTLDGEGAECTLNGLYVVDGSRLVDNHTAIDHARPHGSSREIYKGILAGHARGVFNGKIIVRPDAQKTDAKQTNKALLLSPDAQITSKPQLEIFANDVKCTHGAAVGQIDDDAIFYLRTRGLGAVEARRLLVRAFADDVLGRMPAGPLRAAAEDELARRLPGGPR